MADKPTSSVDPNKVPSDPNAEPLSPKSKEPQTATDAKMQYGADQSLEQPRSGTVFGDNTSSSGNQNVNGLHGRDGGVRGAPEGGGPNNPQPAKEVMDTSEAAKGNQ
jgi:hypothetical protein